MAIVADTYTYVVGVDTHAATHHYAIVETRSGGQIAHGKFPTHAAGLLRAVDWISRRTSVDDNPALTCFSSNVAFSVFDQSTPCGFGRWL